MTEMVKTQDTIKKSRLPSERKARSAYSTLGEASEDPEAKRLCAIILEVLGGLRTPTDAAGALGVSVPRYYALEARALRGLLRACQRRSKGRKRTQAGELAHLKLSLERVTAERERLQAILRVSQRAMGLPAPQKPERLKKRRQRRPQVRALRASKSLKDTRVENPLERSQERGEDSTAVKG